MESWMKKVRCQIMSNKVNGEYIFSEDCKFSLDDKKTGLNNNYLYIGAPGTGKTRSEFYNILHQLDRNHVIVDVKGSMASLVPLLEENGYKIYYLNLVDLHRSMYYNPLAYIRKRYSQTDLMSLARTIYGCNYVSKDPFWDESAISFLHAALTYTYEKNSQEGNGSLKEAFDIIYTLRFDCDGEMDCMVLQDKINELINEGLDVYSSELFFREVICAPKTLATIFKTLRSRTSALQNPDVLRTICDGAEEFTIDFKKFVHEKSVIFIQVNDADTSLHRIASVFLSQLFQFLFAEANKQKDLRLPIPVQFHLDDMANYEINDFASIIATARSRVIGITGCIQSKNQLASVYKDDAINIQDCFDTTIYMGTNSYDSALDIAHRSGFTLDYVNELPVGDIILIRRGRTAEHIKLLDYSKTGKYFIYNHNRYLIPKNRFRIHDDLRHIYI